MNSSEMIAPDRLPDFMKGDDYPQAALPYGDWDYEHNYCRYLTRNKMNRTERNRANYLRALGKCHKLHNHGRG